MVDSPIPTATDRISLRQLRLFEAVGEFNSVRRASEECSLSQPAVTQSLANLECQIGTKLVDRTASGSYLNEDGRIFYERTRRFFQHAGEAIIASGAASSDAEATTILNRLTRAQLRALIFVCDHGDIPDAAAALGITVASLQRAARDIEANLRSSLFYRTAMGVIVNPRGRQLGRAFKLALQEIELALEEIAEALGDSQRQIIVGAMPFGGSVLIAAVLEQFIVMNQKAAIRIMSESAAEVIGSLRSGDVDMVVGLLPDERNPDLAYEALAQTPYSIAVRAGHPLLERRSVTLADLKSHDWVVGTRGSSRRAVFERLFVDGAPHSRLTTGSLPIIRHMLAESDRLTLTTSYELHHEPALRALPFDGIRDAPSIGVTTRKNWKATRLHAAFLDLLRQHVSGQEAAHIFRPADG